MPDASNAPTSPPCPTCTLLTLQPKDPAKKRTPRVEELLRQNLPPLELELADFRVIIDKSPEIMQDLDAKIVQATETLNHLKEARRAAESHLEDAKALVHPIRSLPNEVLAGIFMHATPSWETCKIDSLNPMSSPWIFTHVCRRWRELAISLPRLWTSILLHFDQHTPHITPRQCAYKAGLYLGRSKDLSLSVILKSKSIISSHHAVFPMLELSVPRWENLYIRMPERNLQCFSGHIFSRLDLLQVQHVNEGQRNGPVTTFKSAPVLRSIFTHDSTWEIFKKVSLPWAQLAEARGLPAYDKPGLECLRKLSSLQHLDVDIGKTYNVINDAMVLPNLQHLVMTERSEAEPGRLKQFFSSLEVPALSSLELVYPDVAERVMHLPRSIGAVEKLTKLDICCEMSNHTRNTQNLLKFLSLLSHVEEFRLRDEVVTQQFVLGLTVSATVWRLPCLRVLDIQDILCDDSLAVNIPTIFDMLESRYNVVAEDEGSQTEDVARPSMTYFLEKVTAPRWLYFQKAERWKDICNALHVECGVILSDGGTDANEGDEEDEENENDEEEIVTEATS